MTTAQLRTQARDAMNARQYAEAADLFRRALAAYPTHHPKSELAAKDKAALAAYAKRCENMAAEIAA